MLDITPIGSCRVVNPIKDSRERLNFSMNRTRSYGYCHSAAEIVQAVKFIHGEIEIPDGIWPLVARGKDRNRITNENFRVADGYVVEICSDKEVRLGDHFIQINYFKHEHKDFFSDPQRSALYWEAIEEGQADAIEDLLEQEWGGEENEAERVLLNQVRITRSSDTTLTQELEFLTAKLPNLLVVTHVNALKKDGQPIPTRSEHIERVKRVCNQLGIPSYDPTLRMREVGQGRAIEGNSDSLAHFTPEFSRILADDWVKFLRSTCA